MGPGSYGYGTWRRRCRWSGPASRRRSAAWSCWGLSSERWRELTAWRERGATALSALWSGEITTRQQQILRSAFTSLKNNWLIQQRHLAYHRWNCIGFVSAGKSPEPAEEMWRLKDELLHEVNVLIKFHTTGLMTVLTTSFHVDSPHFFLFSRLRFYKFDFYFSSLKCHMFVSLFILIGVNLIGS